MGSDRYVPGRMARAQMMHWKQLRTLSTVISGEGWCLWHCQCWREFPMLVHWPWIQQKVMYMDQLSAKEDQASKQGVWVAHNWGARAIAAVNHFFWSGLVVMQWL